MERDLKQLSRGLHGMNRALNYFFFLFQGDATHFKTKRQTEQENEMFLILYPRQPVLLLFSGLLLFLFSFLWMTTRHCGIGYTTCLLCLWIWKYSDTHSSFNICLGSFDLLTSSKAKQSTQSLSAFFRRQPKPVLDKCQSEIRHIGAIVFAEL